MQLYETATAPNPRRVRMFLAEKGLLDEVERIEIDLQRGDNLTPEFTEKNPFRKVPVLELADGTTIAETLAICRYFEAAYPASPALLGTDARSIAQIEQWLRWLEFYFMLPVGMCFQHTSGYFKDRMNPIPEWGEDCHRQAGHFYDFLEQHLGQTGQPYLCGDSITAADISAFCTLAFARVVKLRIQPEQPHLAQWYARMSERESAQV